MTDEPCMTCMGDKLNQAVSRFTVEESIFLEFPSVAFSRPLQ